MTERRSWLEKGRARAGRLRSQAGDLRSSHRSIDASFALAERDKRIAAGVLAGGISFRLFLWLLPFALIIGGVFGFLSHAGSSDPEQLAEDFGLAGVAVDSVADAAQQAEAGRFALLLVGIVLLGIASYTSVRALQLVFALAWDQPSRRPARPHAAAAVFTGLALALLAVLLGAVRLRESSAGIGLIVTLASGAALFAIWLVASMLLPHRSDGWRTLVPGAVLFAVGAEILHALVAFFVIGKLERSSALYGALGLAATFMVALYLVGRLIVGSAILNATLYERRAL